MFKFKNNGEIAYLLTNHHETSFSSHEGAILSKTKAQYQDLFRRYVEIGRLSTSSAHFGATAKIKTSTVLPPFMMHRDSARDSC